MLALLEKILLAIPAKIHCCLPPEKYYWPPLEKFTLVPPLGKILPTPMLTCDGNGACSFFDARSLVTPANHALTFLLVCRREANDMKLLDARLSRSFCGRTPSCVSARTGLHHCSHGEEQKNGRGIRYDSVTCFFAYIIPTLCGNPWHVV